MRRFSNIKFKILGKAKAKLDEILNVSDVSQAIATVRQFNKENAKSTELWTCSICSKQVPVKDYAKHYFKCYSKKTVKGK